MEAKILIVDDSKTDQIIISNMLSDFDVLIADDGLEAILLIDNNSDIDLIILDLNMPKMNGFEVLKILRGDEKYSKMRTIILTNFDEIDNEIMGLKLGAVDYIRKPINIESLRIRIGIHLRLKSIQKKIEQDNEILEKMVAIRTRELVATRDITIHALVGLLEVRNIESSNHSIRTQKIMKTLCEHIRTKEKYKKVLTDAYIDELVTTAPLHDIGKVGIPDRILLKPGKLTEDEFEIMKQHVPYGVNALKSKQHEESIPSFIRTSINIVATHHEKYNGTGYPLGLAGDTIPLAGRLMAVIDVYDALISKRVYKPAYQHAEAIEHIKEESGKHFDPDIVSGFLEIQDKVLEITCRYMQEIPKEEA